MRILFYQPYNQIVVYIESVLEQFANEGHATFFLSHDEKGDTHRNLERFGCKTFSAPVKRKNFFQYYKDRITCLSKFCKDNKIDIVYSHFQEANIISVLAQYFCEAKFIINRHHTDCGYVDNNLKERLGDKIINRLSKVYIATSPKVFKQIVEVERTNPEKVQLINYGYNFEAFRKVDPHVVNEIRNQYDSELLLVKAARFIPEKRHFLLINTVKKLVEEGYDIKLLLLGKGSLEESIRQYIIDNKLENHVYLIGFKTNVMDYFAASDLVIHFSLSEASNSAIKEAAITDTAVAVCTDVGDFDEYIVHEQNGALLSKENPGEDLVAFLKKVKAGQLNLMKMGRELHQEVLNRFDIKNVTSKYKKLNESLLSNGE